MPERSSMSYRYHVVEFVDAGFDISRDGDVDDEQVAPLARTDEPPPPARE